MRGLATDALRNFKFIVTIVTPSENAVSTNIAHLGFMTVDGLGIQNEVIPYREGGDNTTTRKMPGQTDFGPLTLSRGMCSVPVGQVGAPSALIDWLSMIFSVMEGQGTAKATDNFRTDLTIDILEHPNVTKQSGAGVVNGIRPIKARFHVYNAWPMAITWSTLDAGGNAVMIETLQLAHEGFVVRYASNQPGIYIPASAVA